MKFNKGKCLKLLGLGMISLMIFSAEKTACAATLPTGAYENAVTATVTGTGNNLTAYTLDEFKEIFGEADYTAFEDFEDEAPTTGNTITNTDVGDVTGETSIYPFNMEVYGVDNAAFPLKFKDAGNQKYLYLADGAPALPPAFSSGTHAVYRNYTNSDTTSAVKFVVGDGNYNVMKIADEKNTEYKIKSFAFVLRYVSSRKATKVTVTYTDGEIGEYLLPRQSTKDVNLFCGFEAPDGKNISEVQIGVDGDKASFAIDDVAIIFEWVEPVADDVKIDGPAVVQTPLYGVSGGAKYKYRAYLVDQTGGEMNSDKTVSLSLSGANSSISFNEETGELTVLGAVEDGTELILTAECPELGFSDEKTITVQNYSYYNPSYMNPDKYGQKVGETTAEPEDDTLEDKALTRDEFVSLLDGATGTPGKDMTVINFVNDKLNISNTGVAQIPLNNSGKTFSLGTGARKMAIRTIDENGLENGSVPTVVPTAGNKYYYLQSSAQGGNEFLMNTEALGDLRVTAMGFVILSHSSLSINGGFRVKVKYSNGKTGYFSQTVTGVSKQTDDIKKANNVFFGIQAPPGHYITNVEIETSTASNKVFSKLDEFGFVFEQPDIIFLERDYSQLKFSDISDEDMQNITKDLRLDSVQSIGTSAITWTTNPGDIIAQDGTLTPPETPDENGATPQVNLIATFSRGALTKERIFELFVPSKLERDRDAITVPTEATADITLPTSGSWGSTITWSAGADSPIDMSSENLGKVSRPQSKDKYVLLTATISNPSGSITKDFGVMVKALNSSPSGGGPSGGSPGGGRGPSSSIAAPTVIPPQKTPVEVKPMEDPTRDSVFTDLSTQHWAYDNIKELYEKGIVNGTGANSFEPESSVTREQYLAMLIRAFEFETAETEASFTDVSKDAWYYDIVLTAQKLGISNGYADGSFGIGKNISREEMAVMAYRAAQTAGISFEEEGVDAAWSDSAEISEFAADAVCILNENGIIKGMSESEFSPKTTSTRAQATVIISRLLEVNAVE